MDIIEEIKKYGKATPKKAAYIVDGRELTYGQLDSWSDALGDYIIKKYGKTGEPVAIYSHKSLYNLVCMLGCVKAGRGYCPIDMSVPKERVRSIIEKLGEGLTIALESLDGVKGDVIGVEKLMEIINSPAAGKTFEKPDLSGADDTFYIIFTSGSTGEPKGVQISRGALNSFLGWSVKLADSNGVYLNQAPFSFDLSVMDTFTSLASGGTIWALTKEVQGDYSRLMESLGKSGAEIWVSTPSFATMCLADKSFESSLLPNLKRFMFCGETLRVETCRKLRERFPKTEIVNTYGPTESTVAVTDVVITEEMLAEDGSLPVGRPKPKTLIQIAGEDGRLLPEGQEGEILILGDSVSKGYYKLKEQTERAFFEMKASDLEKWPEDEGVVRGYRTGDMGFLKDGMLHFSCRRDGQIKLHGYRMELSDIEHNLMKIPGVQEAVVLPNVRRGEIKSLTAFLAAGGETVLEGEEERAETARIKEQLRAFLPDYMVPKKLVFMKSLPLTQNGKIDRKALKELMG